MCGMILAPRHFPVESVQKALLSMDYRGADSLGGLLPNYKGWHLGHVRLAVQTTELTGVQPFQSKGQAMAFVGEVFDRGGLTEEQILWKTFSGRCHQAHYLDGFWSVIRIGEEGVASAYTDHLGVKPLYYWEDHGIVCSEITPMFHLAPAPPLDKQYLANCVKFGYDHSGRTPWTGIRQVGPGTALRLSRPNSNGDSYGREDVYWDWEYVPHPEGDPADFLKSRIVEWATGSNRPVGLLLSGGLDSTIIYEVLRRASLETEIKVFTMENGEDEYLPDDPSIVRLSREAYPTLEEVVQIMQAPLDLGSLLPQVSLARALQEQGINVCLSGDGADELFGGYRRAKRYDSQLSDVFCELPYYHLPRLDRVMMRSTVEMRTPFLSPRVVKFALELPWEHRTSKEYLKDAFRNILPERVRSRDKHPLKSPAVVSGGEQHRLDLLEAFYAEFR